ncbi:bacillithiol biosynthesis cysteine-adding enzyme BshC [Formosa sediminum]|uniref:Putative cysteine ligase BshC n=1 Tax=Formosa sediminum TaxID=2594004 RepID=A0A516GRD8_9FLAO|nr:bacillithiol biosynthesis cysteine-adding enzyme BshC [Formosa sediminum]QDO94091.1 bacillithiol biosynthesis cysteine-adding enzyme BshC [Formosa sediminum]
MPTDCIPFKDIHYFSSLICDYIDQKPELKPFYNRFPKLENFEDQIKEKSDFKGMSKAHRQVLASVLEQQYKSVTTSEATQLNISLLKESNTFTVTTGHQLNLFTGPLYFLYKIVSTINLTKELKTTYPDQHFVPVYWMATEDHDFDEINYFNFKGKKVQWNREDGGAVGPFSTAGLEDVFELYAKELGVGKAADELRDLFSEAYLKHETLADATRYLANALFAELGLVIIDANHSDLKRAFIPYIKQDILSQVSAQEVSKTNTLLSQIPDTDYNIQVNPRAINLFYLSENSRERIVLEHDRYSVINTQKTFTKDEILEEIEAFPERFSPNVIMRPLYQEVILPNLCYIGGGGELAYWLQLKDYFKAAQVPFPMLLLRNSVLIKTKQQAKKLEKLNISNRDLFYKRDTFINKRVRSISNIEIDFSSQKKFLQEQFKEMYTLAAQTDASFLGAVKAQERKQIKGLEHLEKRLLKAQKKKLADQVLRMTELKDQLFPNQSLQERIVNFSELYLEFGDQLIPQLVLNLQPLKQEFLILNL